MKPLDQIITIREAAPLMRLGKRRVLQLCKSGALPARRSGATWLILRESAVAWRKSKP